MSKIYNDESGKVVKGTSKADTIENHGSNVSIAAGAGNDSISSESVNVTVSGGAGNDYYDNNWGRRTAYVYTSGNDTIDNFNDIGMLVIAGKYSTVRNNGTVTITVKNKGTITLNDYWSDKLNTVSSLSKVKRFNLISNDKNKKKITGTTGDDHIWNGGANVTIDAGKGNDYVDSWNSGAKVSISTGAGDDTVGNNGNDATINLGSGNDSIDNGGDNVTINGGTGKNYIHSWGEAMAYVYGGGNDTVDGFNFTSTLVLGKAKVKSSVMSNENGDVTLSMSDGGSVILKQYRDKAINTVSSVKDVEHRNVIRAEKSKTKLNGTSGKDVILINDEKYSKVTINAGAGNDFTGTNGTKHFVDLGDGDDVAENSGDGTTISGGKGKDSINNGGNNVTINGGTGNDLINNGGNNVTIAGGKGKNYIHSWGEATAYVYGGGNDTLDGFQLSSTLVLGKAKVKSSVKSDNNGDVTLSMSDGGSILLKQYWKDTINTVASAKNVEHLNIIRNEKNKANIKGTSDGDIIISTGEWDNKQNIMLGYSNVKITAAAGNDFTKTSGTKNSVDLGSGNDVAENWGSYTTINGGKGNDYIENYREGGEYSSIVGGAGNDSLINHAQHSTVDGGDGNDYIDNHDKYVSLSGGTGNDTIINDWTNFNTIAGGAGNDYIDGRGNGLVYVYSAGNDTISQFDNGDMIVLGSVKVNSSVRADDTITLKLSNKKTLTLTNYWSDNVNVVKSIKDLPNFIENFEDGKKIKGTAKSDYIANEASNVSIAGGKGNDYIGNWGFNTTINGGAGDDTVNNSEAGMVYVYKSGTGNDLIQGFGTLETLVVDGAKYSTVKSGDNILVKVGKNTVTLAGAAGLPNANIVSSTKKVSPLNVVENSTKNKTIKGKSSSNWIRNFADKVTISGGASNDDIYNGGSNVVIRGGGGSDQISNEGSNVSINGGDGADRIFSWGGNTSIAGGKGNDSLWGGENTETFIYANGDGNDVIYGFDNTDMLQITGKFSSSYSKSKGEIYFKVGSTSNAITLKDFSASSFNVNGTSYKISGSTLKKK